MGRRKGGREKEGCWGFFGGVGLLDEKDLVDGDFVVVGFFRG